MRKILASYNRVEEERACRPLTTILERRTTMSALTVLRADVIALCVGLGYKTASSWNKKRMNGKLKDLAELVSDDPALAVGEDVEDHQRLNGLLKRIGEAGGVVEVVQELPEETPEEMLPDDDDAPEVDDEEEAEDDEEDDEEEDVVDKEPAAKKPKPKTEKTGKADKKEPKAAKKPKVKTASCFGVALDLLCQNPDMPFKDLRGKLEEQHLFKLSSARTASSSVSMVVSKLRAYGHMK